MPLNAETEAILKDLEGDGFDLTSIRQQANHNPILENKANSRLGGGLLRREEYTKYKATADEQVANLQKQVRELAAAHDSVEGFKGNDTLYNAALEKITILEENLIAQGFDPVDVRNLSHQEKEQLKTVVSQAKTKDEAPNEEERKQVPNKDNDYVDARTLQTTLANLAGGVMLSTVKIQRQLNRADKLGVNITPELETAFERNLLAGLESGKSYETIADETFGFAAIEKANNEKLDNERIETRAREITAEKLKEIGVPESAARTRPKSIMDSYTGRLGSDSTENAIKGEGGTILVRGRQLPANKFGDAEFYKLRGDRATRIAHAVASMNELQDKRPELFEDPY
jgi:hypothetical protein